MNAKTNMQEDGVETKETLPGLQGAVMSDLLIIADGLSVVDRYS